MDLNRATARRPVLIGAKVLSHESLRKVRIFNGFEGKSTDTTLALISIRRNGVVNKLTHRRRSYSEGCRRRLGLTERTSLSSRHSPYGSWPSTTPRCVSGCARPAATSIARWQCLTNEAMVHPRGCQTLRFSGRRCTNIYDLSMEPSRFRSTMGFARRGPHNCCDL